MTVPLAQPEKTPAGRSRVKLYRRPFARWHWLRRGVYAAAGVAFVGVVAMLVILKPHRDKALSYDLETMRHLERSSIIYDRHHEEIGRIYLRNRTPVRIDDMPFHLVQALVATEDSRYFSHAGVDFVGITRAALKNLKPGGFVQGASTITQQLARNSFGLRGRTLERKLTEAFLAHRIEQHYSKAQILELYLNRIYFGAGFYGIEAAAQGYFGKPARALAIDESAVLCGLIKAPVPLSPFTSVEASRRERNYVLDRMRRERMISADECEELQGRPLVLSRAKQTGGEGYEYEAIRQRVIERVGFDEVAVGGFKIYTTIDRGIQARAESALRWKLDEVEGEAVRSERHQTYAQYDELHRLSEAAGKEMDPPDYLQGAVLMIDNETGGIIALVGGRDFGHNEYNRALQARRPVGTAFKPIVYAAAFEEGKFPGTLVADAPLDNRLVMIGGTTGILGEWGAERVREGWQLEVSAREALVRSFNAATVRLGLDVGLEKVKDLARRAGITSPLRDFPATFLGASEVTMAEMCLAYTIFPNNGKRPPGLHIIDTIRDADNKAIYQYQREEHSRVAAADPIAAYQVHSCLEQALTQGTGAPALSEFALKPMPAAGKTGTHYNFTDLWFLGYNSAVTCGVWVGFDQPRTIYHGAFSNRIALPVWTEVMNASTATFVPRDFTPPDAGETIEICTVSGLRATDRCYEPIKDLEGNVTQYIRCTFKEVIRSGEGKRRRFCEVHSEGGVSRDTLEDLLASAPKPPERPEDSGTEPVMIQAPTVVGDDLFNSLKPAMRAIVVEDENDPTAFAKRAQVVTPTKMGSEKARIHLEPPPPLKIE